MTKQDYKDEIARLQDFTLRLANKIFLAHEVLANLAEKKINKGRRVAGSKWWDERSGRWVPLYTRNT